VREVGATQFPEKGCSMHQSRIPAYLFLIPIGIVSYFSWLAAEFQLDDALIYLRYIRNFHEGNGLSYNPGEAFNGLTSPLFSYIILTATYLLDYQAANTTVSALFFAGATIMAGLAFARGRLEFVLITSLLAGCSYFYTTFGMETSLYLFMIGSSLLLLRRNSDWFVVTLGLLGATRSEGVFLAIPAFAYFVFRNRRLPRLWLLALSAVLFLAPLAANTVMYGSPFADTANAKIGQGKSGLWGERFAFLHIRYMLKWFFGGSLVAVLIILAASFFGVSRARHWATTQVAGLFMLLLGAFYLVLNIPHYHWYYAPFFYFFAIFSGIGVAEVLGWLHRGASLSVRSGFALVFLGSFMVAYAHVLDFQPKATPEPYGSIGRWIDQNTDAEASVALIEIGAVGWNTSRYIVDILGLVSRYNADYIAKRDWLGWLRHYQPDFIVRHDPVWPHERSIPPLESKGYYRPVASFNFPGFVMLQRNPDTSREEIAQLAAH